MGRVREAVLSWQTVGSAERRREINKLRHRPEIVQACCCSRVVATAVVPKEFLCL